ncbi:Gfo/Idh/MocA family oxidoreductase [Chitinivorax sp. B]|uniref:Gfo/Idh/MocA family oxidoreductase n=1 Tax=Chitinivorax sp. B TaxID=2502235 RepID=UPI0010F5B52A|nr:Gfo/Idh/MocA family oxidoreductase [Chitinivorax sp. B]
MNTINIGIVGLGRLGKRHALNLAQRVPGARIVAACSPVADELGWASQVLPTASTYTDYAQLLRHPDLDAVFLVTPTSLHAEQIIAALQAGKHVFCEKPLALNMADCLRVEQVAAAFPHQVATIGFVRRFDPSYRDAFDKIRAGQIGTPYLLRSQTCDQNDPSGFFVRFAETSGGIFMDCSVHDIDLARWLLGANRAKRVWATGTIAIHHGLQAHHDVDNGIAMCEFGSGQLATFFASRTQAHGHETATEVFGTTGRLAIGSNPRKNRVEISDQHGVRSECVGDFFERFSDAFLLEAQDFVNAVLQRRAPVLTLADATEATRIGLAITEAFRTKQMVTLD